MKVKLLRNPSDRFGCKLKEGETGEVPKDVADSLVKLGIAVEIESPSVVKAVPEKPAIAEAEAPEIKAVPEEPKPAAKKRRRRS